MSTTNGQLLYALDTGDFEALPVDQPIDERDSLQSLLTIYAVWRPQIHPTVARLKWRLEDWFMGCLDSWSNPRDDLADLDTVEAIHLLARADNQSVYDWLATTADWDQLTTFLGVELPARFVAAFGLPSISDDELPMSALYSRVLHGLLATHPELPCEQMGAEFLQHLQLAPRVWQILVALNRLRGSNDLRSFFTERSQAKPRHTNEFVIDHERTLRGARWRYEADARLHRDLHTLLATRELASA